jgi:hypothetical protein
LLTAKVELGSSRRRFVRHGQLGSRNNLDLMAALGVAVASYVALN